MDPVDPSSVGMGEIEYGWPPVSTTTGDAGAGGLLRNASGGWLGGFQRFLAVADSMVAECWALRDGLQLARSLNISAIDMKLDAKTVVDLLEGHNEENLYLTLIILDYMKLIGEFPESRVSHIFREANSAADFMA